jgi:uncharacterized membrane protein
MVPTRSVPVLSRPGSPPASYSPYGGSNVAPGGAASEWASAASGAGLGQGSAQSHGAYIVEETQELVLPPAAPNVNVPLGAIEESSAPRPRVVNAGGAAAAAYQQFDQTGSFAALRPGAEQVRAAGEFGRNGALASGGAADVPAPQVSRRGTNPMPAASRSSGNQWQGTPTGGGYAAPPALASAMGAPRPSGMGRATGAPPQQYGAVAPHAGTSLFGPALDRGTVTIALSANTAAALSYLFGFLTGIFFYFGERDNRYVRFHAWQSSALSLILILLGVITYGGVWLVYIKVDDPAWNLFALLVAGLIGLAMLVLWLWTMAEAWTGHYVRLPIIGHWAEYFAATPQDAYAPEAGV